MTFPLIVQKTGLNSNSLYAVLDTSKKQVLCLISSSTSAPPQNNSQHNKLQRKPFESDYKLARNILTCCLGQQGLLYPSQDHTCVSSHTASEHVKSILVVHSDSYNQVKRGGRPRRPSSPSCLALLSTVSSHLSDKGTAGLSFTWTFQLLQLSIF